MIHPASHTKDRPLFSASNVLTALALGSVVAGAAVIAAPYVLPEFGVGSAELAAASADLLHVSAEAGGSGIAGGINNLIAGIPLVGEKLADGGFFTAIASGVVGLTGVLIGNRLDHDDSFNWGTLIKYAALTTSAIIALPTLLTAIGTGIIYLASLGGDVEMASNVVGFVDSTIGTMKAHTDDSLGLTGIAAALPHLFTCGVPLIPAAVNFMLPAKHQQHLELVEDDPRMTDQQREMLDAYNKAPAIKKPLMQKWFKDQGFTPDFHADGTMHLFAHTTGLSR